MFFCRKPTFRSRVTVFLCLLAAAPILARESEPDGFSLSLDFERIDRSEENFALELTTLGFFDPSIDWDPGAKARALEIEDSTGDTAADPDALIDLQKELEEQRWPDGKTRMEVHMRSELLDQMSGGAVNSVQDGALFDVMGLVSYIKSIRKARKAKRLPAGSRVQRNQTLVLNVREDDGSTPPTITVLPMVLGWVGDVLVANCGSSGKCTVEGLPDNQSTLLVRGTGAAFVGFSPGRKPQPLDLEPVGILKLMPPADATGFTRARLTHRPTKLQVPVIRWLNPGRGEWFNIPPTGLPLLLPQAAYEIEWMDESSASHETTIVVESVAVTHLALRAW